MNVDQHLYRWISVANERIERLGFPPGFAEASVYRLKTLMGEQYLGEVFSSTEPLHLLGLRGKELETWLRGGANVDEHITQLLELSAYLERFSKDVCLKSKLLKLERDSFWPVFFELAMAYRLDHAARPMGKVSLSCENEKAVGDFILTVNGRAVICECASLMFGESEVEQFRLLGDLYAYIERKVKRIESHCCLKIRISDPVAGPVYNSAVRCVKRVLAQFDKSLAFSEITEGSVSISAENLTDTTERVPFRYRDERVINIAGSDWNSAHEIYFVNAENDAEAARRYRAGMDIADIEHARIFVKFPHNRADFDPYLRLEAKIKAKTLQTDVPGTYLGRLIFLESPWHLQLMEPERLSQIVTAAYRRSRSTIAVIICERKYNSHYRNWYMHFHSPLNQSFALDTEIVECLTRFKIFDRDFDPILGTPYSQTWEQAAQRAAVTCPPESSPVEM